MVLLKNISVFQSTFKVLGISMSLSSRICFGWLFSLHLSYPLFPLRLTPVFFLFCVPCTFCFCWCHLIFLGSFTLSWCLNYFYYCDETPWPRQLWNQEFIGGLQFQNVEVLDCHYWQNVFVHCVKLTLVLFWMLISLSHYVVSIWIWPCYVYS